VGNNPTIKVLLLHGGPGLTHELYECFDGYFPNESIEYIYYDQLGSYYSDQPNDNSYGQPNVSSKKWNKSELP
jgi:proline iminopeptidase